MSHFGVADTSTDRIEPRRLVAEHLSPEVSGANASIPKADVMSPLSTDALNTPFYVVDDDSQFCSSIKFLFDTLRAKITVFANAPEFLLALVSLPPGGILLDMRMPQMNGIDFLRALSERGLHWPVVVLSGHGEIEVAVQAIKLGAMDFLEKPIDVAKLLGCLERATKQLQTQNQAERNIMDARNRLMRLTPREFEVLDALCSGQANKQIAYALSISPRTIEMHRSNALKKLEIKSIADLIAIKNAAGVK